MILYVNSRNEIKDVNNTSDTSLTALEVNENNPFANWTVAKICCFKVEVQNGNVVMYIPYVNSQVIEHIDRLSNMDKAISADVIDTQLGLAETYEKVVDTESDVTDIELAITELYELMLGGV